MVAALPPPNIFRVPKPFGAVPPSANLPASLQVVFDPAVLRALEALSRHIEREALDPLLTAEPREGLKQTFEAVYPRFFSYYIATALTLAASIKEPKLLTQLVTFCFDVLRDDLQRSGPNFLGRDATVSALIGVHSMARVIKAAAGQFAPSEPQQREALEMVAPQFTTTLTAYMLTMFAVSYALGLGDRFKGRPENVATLARWSRDYAAKAYDVSVQSGLLRLVKRPPGDRAEGESDVDLQLADAGLEEYVRLLQAPVDADHPDAR
jgi:hypothetical protein